MRAILHIDMDAFYASVEEQDRPELKGKPLIVGGTGGRGVVAAASYAVRRFGVRSAMPMREALRRCPEAVVVHPRMARYKEISDQVFAIFREFTPEVEGLSLDEAFLDVTASQQLLGAPETIGAEIRRRIAAQTGLTASVGIATNKLLAKIASDLNKPDGMCRIDAGNLREILDPLPIHKLFGVGQKTLPTVLAAGIRTFGDARAADEAVLWRAFGKHGNAMRDRAAGLDDRPVGARSRGEVHQRGGDLRYGYSRAGGAECAAQGVGGSHRVAAAGSQTAGRTGERQDSPRRFYNLHSPACARASDPGYGHRIRCRASAAQRLVGIAARRRRSAAGGRGGRFAGHAAAGPVLGSAAGLRIAPRFGRGRDPRPFRAGSCSPVPASCPESLETETNRPLVLS